MARAQSITTLGAVVPMACAWGESIPASGQQLPAGSGRGIAAAHCVSCHDSSRLVTSGYDRTGWDDVIERMAKPGVVLSADARPRLSGYLARGFPPQPDAAAKGIAGVLAESGAGKLALVDIH